MTTNFGHFLRIYMFDKRHSLRTLAKEIGISHATLHRIEKGKPVDGRTMLMLINWMFGEAKA